MKWLIHLLDGYYCVASPCDAFGTRVSNVKPCQSLISSWRISVTSLCCLTIDLPLHQTSELSDRLQSLDEAQHYS